ncbi:RB1-inducible coiled-coil protein 1 isoform X2 [Sitophilus oryzae]|uniref:RB1-inducible coiled-coil protein 1 isoform X2 n=1 Tax=Sitophilus oryzae TaxID=7048 RepID=A0A6J2YC33_SITOR|nr:RB1-inducible coiled-coil protein 1 isoform X2 [Sitophilus oryzae]
MVYVFFVQPGDMISFDNEITIMQSVEDLKDKIKEKVNIPQDQQVLLISGGESLDVKKNLCSYMAGTDTNPIYLFSTNYEPNRLDILKSLNYNDLEIKQRLTECMNLPVSLATVKTRTLVAMDFFNIAKTQLEFCENLVHDQHLQQQGWSAVIANLEDIVGEFRKRWDLFLKVYNEFMADKTAFSDLLEHFPEDKNVLQKMPVIDILLEAQKEPLDSSKLSESTNISQENEGSRDLTLYEWISSSENKNSLEELHSVCRDKLRKFENEIMPSLENHISETLQSAEKPERKEIEGLGKRLCDLEELLRKIKKYVEHQSDMAQAFQQNETRASHTKDISILPDLCTTHLQQLEYIKQCHLKLMEDRNRVIRAKYELSKSLCARIGWVQNIENKLWELDSHLVYFHEHLQRLRKHIEVFQQVHLAPTTYVNAVVEVVRRRAFSQLFLMWASDLACQNLTIHNEELTRRKEFTAQFEGHFLNTLFPGMGDVPPPFAIEAPAMFDAKLPEVTREDVERLRRELPEFAESLTLPDMDRVTNFFLGKAGGAAKEQEKDKVDDAKAVEDKLIQAVSDVGLASNLDKNLLKATGSEPCLVTVPGLPNLKDDKGCESETDTEEFEKVGQSPLELTFPQGAAQAVISAPKVTEKQDASTSTEARNQVLPPKKPPRSFHRASQSFDTDQRTLSTSTNESFTNIKNISLDSIDELSSIKNFSNATTESCFNSHYNQALSKEQSSSLSSTSSLHLSENIARSNVASHYGTSSLMLSRSKSVSPQSPRDNASPQMCHQQQDFVSDEFYIDESLPSSVGTGNSQGSEFVRQLDNANIVVAMLQDNLQISRSQYEKVKGILSNLGSLSKQDVNTLRGELRDLKSQFVSESREFTELYSRLGGSLQNLDVEIDKSQKELAEVMLKEQEHERDTFRYSLLEKESTIKVLERDKKVLEDRNEEISRELAHLEEKMAQLTSDKANEIEDLCKKIREKELEKEKALKETTEFLRHEHKAEIENIKSRFKLMTMERSPSLSSLEKEKSGDFASLPSTILAQMQNNFEIEKERAVLEERQRCDKLTEEKIKDLEMSFVMQKDLLSQDVAKRIAEDKDLQIDTLREREKNLNLEVIKLKTTIQQLAECEQERIDCQMMEEFDTLKKEKDELEEELHKLKSERETQMITSVAVCEEKLDASTSPLQTSLLPSHDLSKSEIAPFHLPPRLSIDTCKKGDIVLVIWDPLYANFRILQEAKYAYFLHTDSLERLGLSINKKVPNKSYCTGEVVNKDFCHARREGNRYHLSVGTKFFRVKVKPVSSLHHKDQSQSFYHPRLGSASMSASQSSISNFDPVMEESQSTTSPLLETNPEEDPIVTKDGPEDGERIALETPCEPGRSDPESGRIDVIERPEEIKPQSVEKNFAEDSGIVESIEQATAATEEVGEKQQEDDRCEVCKAVEVQKANSSANWLEAMFRSMFSKSSQ